MPLYHYKAYSVDRTVVHGMLYCESLDFLYETLKSKNLTLFKKWKKSHFNRFISLADLKEWSYFCKTLIKDSIPLKEALLTSAELSESNVLKEVLHQVLYDIERGVQLSVAISVHEKKLGRICVAAFATAEETGNLESAFDNLEDYYGWRIHLKQNVTNALRYPLFVLGFMILVIMGLQTHLVPELFEFYKAQGEVPSSLMLWMNMSEYLYLLAFPALFLIPFILKINKIVSVRVLVRFVPFGKLLYTLELAKFMASFSLMMKSRIDLKKALTTSALDLRLPPLKKELLAIEEQLKRGISLSAAFNQIPYIDKLVPRFVYLGEKAGDLTQHLNLCGDILTKRSLSQIHRFIQVIQPMLIGAIGILLLWIATTLVTPIYNQLPELAQ